MTETIGIIGFGNMGSSIAQQIRLDYRTLVFDRDKNKTKDNPRIQLADSLSDLLKQAQVIILAVKPQDFRAVLTQIKDRTREKLIISIAAGITTRYIEKYLGQIRVIRVMPNLASKIAQGMNCLSKGRFASSADLNFSIKLFKRLGITLVIGEKKMDAATAVSGSGPAYFYDFLDAQSLDYRNIPKPKIQDFTLSFKDAAKAVGFSSKEAGLLVDTTIKGALALLKATDAAPQELKKRVASKGGTSEAALEVLHRGGSLKEAVKAAYSRAKTLSKERS